ncbi:MAG: hypothetical protein P8O78_07520 [Flavobacteriaceae bacterium]|nr:hypothetical protein [Flavobacteriaceae bacterium]
MKTIIATEQFDYENHSFVIDLVQYEDHFYTIEIIQSKSIKSSLEQSRIILKPEVISQFIKVLQNFNAKSLLYPQYYKKHLSALDEKDIQKSYLKGVSIRNLALQFGQSIELIEMILRNNGIVIAENKPPRYWPKRYRKRKK